MDILSAICREDDSGGIDCVFTVAGLLPAVATATTDARLVAIEGSTISVLRLDFVDGESTSDVSCVPQSGAVGSGHTCSATGSSVNMHFDSSIGCLDSVQAILEQPGGTNDNLLFSITPSCGQ